MPAITTRRRNGLPYTLAIIAHQRDYAVRQHTPPRPSAAKLDRVAERAKLGLPLFTDR